MSVEMANDHFGANNDVHRAALTLYTQGGTVVSNWNQGSCNVYQQQPKVEEPWPFNILPSVKVKQQNQERSVAEQRLVYSPQQQASFGTGDYSNEYLSFPCASPNQVSTHFH